MNSSLTLKYHLLFLAVVCEKHLFIAGLCCVFPNSYVSENVSSFRCSRTGNED